MRTIFLSDLHLARRSSLIKSFDHVVPLLANADRVVLGGDIMDFGWTPQAVAEAALRHAEEISSKLNAEVIWLAGNHDIHLPRREPFYRQGPVLYTHGHLFYKKLPPPPTVTLEEYLTKVRKRYPDPGSVVHKQVKLICRVVDTLAPLLTMRICQIHNADRTAKQNIPVLMRVAKMDGIRQIVMGHTHLGGVRRWKLADGTEVEILNTGGWLVNSRPLVSVQEGKGMAELHYAVKRPDGTWIMGDRVTKKKVF